MTEPRTALPAREHATGVPGLRILRLDYRDRSPEGDRRWRARFELDNAWSQAVGGEDANSWDPDREREALAGTAKDIRYLLAELDGVPVGTGDFFRRVRDEPETAGITPCVAIGWTGRGIGRALGEALLTEAREAGVRELITDVMVPLRHQSAGVDPERALRFAAAAGFAEYQRLRCQVLPLPLTGAFCAAAADVLARGVAGYRVEVCLGEPPEAWRAGLARLHERFVTDAPPGERPVAPQSWDAARVAENYHRYVELGETLVVAAAFAPDGTMAGYTDTSYVPSAAHVVHQGDTLVAAEHRGHGLGRALKLAAIGTLAPRCPGARVHRTSNAVENEPMLRVNRELGYLPDFEMVMLRRGLS